MTNAVVVAVKGEVLYGGSPNAKLVAAKAEVLYGGKPTSKLVSLKAEVMYSNVTSAVARRRVLTITT